MPRTFPTRFDLEALAARNVRISDVESGHPACALGWNLRLEPTFGTYVWDDTYDSNFLVRALRRDFETNGPPLVYRLDRASAHKTDEVRNLFAEYEVLVLHGPPRCPRFYGQLERQNLEHRQWCEAEGIIHVEDLETRLTGMLKAVSEIWRRRTLGFRTAAEVWQQRPRLDVDRALLRSEVSDRTDRIRRSIELRGKPADIAERLAIQQALETRGYLHQEVGGWC